MSKVGPILIVDNDIDDHDILKDVIEELGIANPLLFFLDAREVIYYLQTTPDRPFVILCDVNMPVMSGLELRRRINEDEYLRQKSIPFIFLTTTAGTPVVKEAYQMSVQGFFEKKDNVQEIAALIQLIYNYWQVCCHPNK